MGVIVHSVGVYTRKLGREADIITLTRIAGILALVFGILFAVFGVVTVIFIVGLTPIVIGVVDILIFVNCEEIVKLVEAGEYRRAKDKTLVWMIVALIFSLIPGILLLVPYLKYDDLIRYTPQYPSLTSIAYTARL